MVSDEHLRACGDAGALDLRAVDAGAVCHAGYLSCCRRSAALCCDSLPAAPFGFRARTGPGLWEQSERAFVVGDTDPDCADAVPGDDARDSVCAGCAEA